MPSSRKFGTLCAWSSYSASSAWRHDRLYLRRAIPNLRRSKEALASVDNVDFFKNDFLWTHVLVEIKLLLWNGAVIFCRNRMLVDMVPRIVCSRNPWWLWLWKLKQFVYEVMAVDVSQVMKICRLGWWWRLISGWFHSWSCVWYEWL